MAMNEEHRQVEVAEETAAKARTLAHSTRNVPIPLDSYQLLAELVDTLSSLEQVCRQLGAWHTRAASDGITEGQAAATAADELNRSAAALDEARERISAAWAANGSLHWS